MAEYIEREAAIEIIEEKQRELCPLGMFSRHAVYGSDREKFDAWEEIIEQMNRVPAADVRPVVRARWIHVPSDGKFRDTCVCSACKKSPPIESWVVKEFNACPYCFADMREGS